MPTEVMPTNKLPDPVQRACSPDRDAASPTLKQDGGRHLRIPTTPISSTEKSHDPPRRTVLRTATMKGRSGAHTAVAVTSAIFITVAIYSLLAQFVFTEARPDHWEWRKLFSNDYERYVSHEEEEVRPLVKSQADGSLYMLGVGKADITGYVEPSNEG
jgi:hypothetical protein